MKAKRRRGQRSQVPALRRTIATLKRSIVEASLAIGQLKREVEHWKRRTGDLMASGETERTAGFRAGYQAGELETGRAFRAVFAGR